MRAEVDSVLAALTRVTSGGEADLRQPFQSLTAEVKKTHSNADYAEDLAGALQRRADSHLSAWESEAKRITNEDLRAKAAARQAAVRGQYNRIVSSARELDGSYKRFILGIDNVYRYLDNDLTREGTASAASAAGDVDGLGREVQRQIDAVAFELGEGAGALSPTIGSVTAPSAESTPAAQPAPAAEPAK
jgi:hypothetical protein